MSFDNGGLSRLRRRASARSQLPSLAATASAHARDNEKLHDYAQSGLGPSKESNARDAPDARIPMAPHASLPSKKPELSTGSDFPAASAEGSRIPRLPSRASTSRPVRKPLDLDECFRLAREKMVRDVPPGSPSPAPRPRPQTNGAPSQQTTPSLLFTNKPISMGRHGVKHTRRESTLEPSASYKLPPHNDEESDEEFAQRMHQFEEDEKNIQAMMNRKSWSKPTGSTDLTRKTSALSAGDRVLGTGSFGNSRPGAPRQDWGKPGKYSTVLHKFSSDPDAARAFNERFGSGIDREQQLGSKPEQQSSSSIPAVRSRIPSPAKGGYSWQVDEEFTDDDLQVSTSPPVGYRRTNTKIDEIRDLERNYSTGLEQKLFPERTNTRMEETRRRELEEAIKPLPAWEPKEPVLSLLTEPSYSPSESEARHIQKVEELARRVANRTRLDVNGKRRSFLFTNGEIEADAAVAQKSSSHETLNHLLHRRNTSDDATPEISRGLHSTAYPSASRVTDGAAQQSLIADNESSQRRTGIVPTGSSRDAFTRGFRKNPRFTATQSRKDESTETAQAKQAVALASDKVMPDTGGNATSSTLQEYKREPSLPKPRVKLPGLPRTSSATSIASESSADFYDPTARIQAEAKLFALGNESERGSLRAPSPVPGKTKHVDTDNEETPRPNRVDPLTMPTPVVTGAFVDSPAVGKTEQQRGRAPVRPSSPAREESRARSLSISPQPSRTTQGDRQSRAHASSTRDPRRTRSTPRRKSPLKNSIRPPTVKDDLRDILKKSHIEDSTLDDFTALVISDAGKLAEEVKSNSKDAANPEFQDEQLRRLNGMSDALKTGLAGIRTARKGIERLEDQISHTKNQTRAAAEVRRAARAQRLAQQKDDSNTNSSALFELQMPRLYQTKPRFRPTLLGLLVLLLALWHAYWATEGLFYEKWGKQKICYRGSPCRWDVGDPDYGYTIPVKVDQWVTGGLIRPHAARWLQEAQDSWADVADWWTGSDIRTVNHQAIRDPGKKQQYWRRLEKKGFLPEWHPDPWMQPQFEMWENEAWEGDEVVDVPAALDYEEDSREDEVEVEVEGAAGHRKDDDGWARDNREEIVQEGPRPATHGYLNAWWA